MIATQVHIVIMSATVRSRHDESLILIREEGACKRPLDFRAFGLLAVS